MHHSTRSLSHSSWTQNLKQVNWIVTVPLIILPAVYLLLPSANYQNYIAFIFSASLSFFVSFVCVFLIQEGVKDSSTLFWFEIVLGWLVFPIGVLGYSISKCIFTNQSVSYVGAGTAAGIFVLLMFFLTSREGKKRSTSNSNKRNVGKILSLGNALAVLGKPGSGKSTYFQFIALAFARNKAGDRKLRRKGYIKNHIGYDEWYLPILIPLRRVASYVYQNISESVESNLLLDAFRQNVLPSELRDGFSDEYLRYMLKRKKVIFLFDGLDEVAGDSEFEAIVNEIKGLISTYSGNKYVVSSRYSGWRGGVGAQFIETEIKDLDNKQIDTFIDSWYKAVEINRRTTSPKDNRVKNKVAEEKTREKGNILKRTLRTVASVRNLASNPLLLSMICFVHYNKTLPEERLSLYQDCSRLLLEQWDMEKGIPKDDIPLTYARKEIIMQEIAYAIHSGEISNEENARETTGQKAIQTIRKTLEKFDIETSQAEALFNKLVIRTGLLVAVENYKDLYQFNHLTFQEFYTARRIFDNNLDILGCIKKSSYNDFKYLIGWWREVILLYSGMKRNPTGLINQLLTDDNNIDFLKVRLQIAAQCVSEAVEKPAAKTEKLVLGELWRIRTLGQRKGIPVKFYSEIKEFLLRFASSYEYYEFVLREKVENISKQNVKNLINRLKKELDTNDKDVQDAIGSAINLLWRDYDLDKYLADSDIIELLHSSNLDLLLNLTTCVSKKRLDPVPDNLTEQVIKETVDYIVGIIRNEIKTIGFDDENDELVRNILQEIKSDVFQNHWEGIKTKLAEAISIILANPPIYNSWSTMPRRALLK